MRTQDPIQRIIIHTYTYLTLFQTEPGVRDARDQLWGLSISKQPAYTLLRATLGILNTINETECDQLFDLVNPAILQLEGISHTQQTTGLLQARALTQQCHNNAYQP